MTALHKVLFVDLDDTLFCSDRKHPPTPECVPLAFLKDGQPIIHLHLTLLKGDFTITGGHAMPGNIIFAGEACITPIEGPRLHRGLDAATGLPLWDQTGM